MKKILCLLLLVVFLASPCFAVNSEDFVAKGIEWGKKGEFDKAIAEFNKAIEVNPNDPLAFYNRGSAYDCKRDYDKAISDYSKAIELNPKFATAYNSRAIDYYYKKDYDKAWEDVHTAEPMFKIHPEFLKMLRKASGREK
ncbi:MAG: tetratricopeptide repeat protein [Candidatus Omnitrophica bacterium]|nr:tetratricopeptide repeat protein [Candidatus Omnitrophota bacterium]